MKKTLLALSLGLLAVEVSAHALWIAQVNGAPTVSFGHTGTNTDAYDVGGIKNTFALKVDGSKAELKAIAKEDFVVFESLEGLGIVTATLDEGYMTEDPKTGEEINKRGDQVKGATSSFRVLNYTVAYQNPRIKPQALGLGLEILPSVNPASLKQGEILKVQVLLDGKALADAQVNSYYFDAEAKTYSTDKEGFASIPVATNEFNILDVEHEIEDPKDPFEGLVQNSSLTFRAKHSGEHKH